MGIVYGRVEGEGIHDKMFELANGLHNYIISGYKSTCCRAITKDWAGDDFKSAEIKDVVTCHLPCGWHHIKQA